MSQILASLLLLFFTISANAADAYYCRCDAGAHASCPTNAGNNGNAGTSSSVPKLDIPANASGFSANDTMFLCTGGSWATVNGFSNNTNFGATTPFKIDWYVPPSGCTGGCATQKPIMSCTATDCFVITYGTGTTGSNKNGFSINHLELSCAAASGVTGTAGVSISNDSNYFTLNNFYIHDCWFGVISTGYLVSIGASDGNNDFLTFTNGTVFNCISEGMFFDGGDPGPTKISTHVLIENVTFDTNGSRRATLDHQLYFNGGMDLNIRHDTFVNSTNNGGSGCGSTVFVTHGYVRRAVYEDNLIQETAAALGGCYGIQINAIAGNTVPDNIADVIVRGNRIINVGNQGILTTGCLRCVMENNIVVWTQNTSLDRACVASQANSAGTDPDTLGGVVTMRNNSCYIASATVGSVGYQNTENGSGHVLVSNSTYFDASSSASAPCQDYGSHTSSDFAASGYNSCYRSGGATFSNKGNLATTQGLGFDANSITSDPTLAATPSAGTNWEIRFSNGTATNAGHPTKSSRLGYRGKAKTGARDIGACEYNGVGDECSGSKTSVPSSPIWTNPH